MTTVSIQEAAQRLGISVVAVRKRAQRGSLNGHKRDGVWYIEIEDGQSAGQPVGSPHVHIVEADTLALLRETVTTLSEQLKVKDQQIADLIRQGERLQSLLGNEQETTQRLLSAGASVGPPPDVPATLHRSEDVPPAPIPNAAPGVAGREIDPSQRPPRRSSWWSRLFGLE